MISTHGIEDPTLRGLLQLTAVAGVFHPCGSRFFGYANRESDFDFFAQHTPGLEDSLKALGFKRRKRELDRYFDINTLTIYKQGVTTAIIVKSAEARLRVQQEIIKQGIRPPKGDTEFWNNLYKKHCSDLL